MRLRLAASFVLFAATSAGAHALSGGGLRIVHPWARAMPPGAVTAAAYLTVKNTARAADRLVAVSSPAAARVEIHAMSTAGGIMRMRQIAGGVAVPANGAVALAPGGGYHLMLVDLKRPLRVGMRVPATLTFAGAGDVAVVFVVEAAPPPSGGMPAGMSMP